MTATARPPAITRLRLERRGGLTGLTLRADCPAARLSSGQHRALAALLKGVSAPPPACGADRFRYRLLLDHADGSARTLDVAEDDWPEALSALLPNAPD